MDELKGKRIFVVEDDITNMAVFAATLRQSGALVIQDHWNSGTIEMLTRHLPIDVILMDLMLRNGTSGYDIYDKLQALPEFASIPVIIVSASDPEIEIPKARERGFAGYIGKPISPSRFATQIVQCMEGTPVWHSQSGRAYE